MPCVQSDGFVFQSGYTDEQLQTGHQWLMEKLLEPSFLKTYVCKKYANRKFLKASVFAVDWARSHMLENLPEKYTEYFATALS